MVDERVKRLADILVNYSISVKKGQTVKIGFGIDAKDLALECYRLIIMKGCLARADAIVPGFSYTFFRHATEEQLKVFPKMAMFEAKNIDGVISIGADYNTREFSNIDHRKVALRSKVVDPISKVVLKKDNWVGCEYPTHSLAQDAEMSLEEFEDFVFNACLQDWSAFEKKQAPVKKVLDRGRKVRIIGEGTDLTFSIAGRKAISSCGKRNMPDGEVFMAPVETTTQGHITYTYPTVRGGVEVDGIRLEFKNGRVVNAAAKKNEAYLKAMIDTDKGARMLGEFGIGTNYSIAKFIKQILFDEKIGGTVHLALGMAYKEGGGKNESALHWDMIKDLRSGGEIWVDDFLLQKNGKFTVRF